MKPILRSLGTGALLSLALLCLWAASASAGAVIPGIIGASPNPTFNLSTGAVGISTPDGDSVLLWAYGANGSPVQYPGPTLIVNQGDTVRINLTNNLPQPVSMVFPGQGLVADPVAGGSGTPGLLTREALANGGTVSYQFIASQPGTYMYHSGTRPDLQVEMGLLGVIIVRPTGFNQNNSAARTAYGHPSTAYDHEYLFLLTDMDPVIHDLVDFGFADFVDNTSFFAKFWFINGRNGMDTLAANDAGWLPNQPYSALARTRPGEKVLLRLVGGGRDQHAFHPHGNHSLLVAVDGRMVSSGAGTGPDLATANFTFTPTPGSTMDTIFNWTSKGLGFDIYGDPTEAGFEHTCTPANPPANMVDPATGEDCTYHGVRLDTKVVLPGLQDTTFGGWYSGSPFLGHFGELPPGEGGLNLNGGLFFMWHSHDEKELINFDIFPGGMLTFVVIEPPTVEIP